jgi:hypothetical protein
MKCLLSNYSFVDIMYILILTSMWPESSVCLYFVQCTHANIWFHSVRSYRNYSCKHVNNFNNNLLKDDISFLNGTHSLKLLEKCTKFHWSAYTGSGRNTWRFCKTVESGTVGVEYLSLSSLLARLKAFSCHWALVCGALDLFQKQRFCLDSEDISSALQYSSERVSLVAVLLPLSISQEQGVRKKTKDNGGFETEHQGRSSSNFS